jgi:hypothetical protein
MPRKSLALPPGMKTRDLVGLNSLYVVVAAMWLVPDRRIETRTK